MLKEFILAIIFGSLIGFGASGALVAINKNKPTAPVITPTLSADISVTAAPSVIPSPTLTVEFPKNESVVSTANITLKGNTSPNSVVLLTTVKNSFQTTADSSGYFSIDLSLNLGANILKIRSLSPDNSENNIEILVTYSTAKI